jgi:NAD(P)-dependent dehydrogenase (short-subunit alcohol dehydrogenase family)
VKVTVITGASRGIGAATARLLGSRGHAVAVGYRTDAEQAALVVADVEEAGGRAVAVRVDTADEAEVDALFDTAARTLGPVTGVVINAGITSPLGPLADTAVADLRRVVEVNLVGALLCARRAAGDLTSGGAVVTVSSAAATLGSAGEYVHYAATKAAVETMTVGLAKELAPRGVRVNAVAPGVIDTDIHALSGDPGRPARVADRVPLGRPGETGEVAAAIAWLLSDEASYTTGAVLRVSGGL